MKKHLFAALNALLLIIFTAYVALNTFVLARVYEATTDGSGERGYVVRNGVIYRESSMAFEALSIMADGGIHGFSFGPALVIDSEIAVTAEDEVGKAMADNPHTAIDVFEPKHYLAQTMRLIRK